VANKRQYDRVQAQIPIAMADGDSAVTRDVSPGGVYILTDGAFEVGQTLRFTIEFDNPIDGGGVLCLDCVGLVKRVDREDGELGVGVSISESRLERRARRAVAAKVRR
jgi:hypothetical protein